MAKSFMKRKGGGTEDGAEKAKKITSKGLKDLLSMYRFILPYKFVFGIGMLFLLFSSASMMVFPYLFGELADATNIDKEPGSLNYVAVLLVVALVLQALFSFGRIYLFAIVSQRAMADIRKTLYAKLLAMPIAFFEKRRIGEVMSRISSDVDQLQTMLSLNLAEFFRQVTTLLVGIIAILFFTSIKLVLLMLCTFPVLMMGGYFFGKFIRRLSKSAQDDLASANVVVEETLQSIHTVKSFANESFEMLRYDGLIGKVVKNSLKASLYRSLFVTFIILCLMGAIVLVLWYGMSLVASGEMTIGMLVQFFMYTLFIGVSVGGIGEIYGEIQKSIGSSERIIEILNEDGEMDHKPVNVKKLSGDIVYNKVVFAYPTRLDADILKGLDLEIKHGQKVALVGASGAGKSTIAQLLMHFYELKGGTITIDGKDIRTIFLPELRKNIGLVPQEVLLFGGSIKENILYGRPDATDAEVIEAAKKANAYEFIERFPEGFETLVGDRGIKLSGGQRQRIAIARAILKDPAILILDEATSSLDAHSEDQVQHALETLMKDRTTIIIAHRLATILKADQIFVINDGEVAEMGKHEVLIQQNGIYANLVKLQFGA